MERCLLFIQEKNFRTLRCIREYPSTYLFQKRRIRMYLRPSQALLVKLHLLYFLYKWRSFYVNPSRRVLYEGVYAWIRRHRNISRNFPSGGEKARVIFHLFFAERIPRLSLLEYCESSRNERICTSAKFHKARNFSLSS